MQALVFQGLDDPKLALIRIDVTHAQYWDERTGMMHAITDLFRKSKAGDEGVVDHEKVDWDDAAAGPGISA